MLIFLDIEELLPSNNKILVLYMSKYAVDISKILLNWHLIF